MARSEAPIIHMGRDLHHYFVPVPASRSGATRYVRGDLVDKLAESLRALVGLAEMRGGHLHEYGAAVGEARLALNDVDPRQRTRHPDASDDDDERGDGAWFHDSDMGAR